MATLLEEIVRRENHVVRAGDFPGRRAGPELRRLAGNGALLQLAHGVYALVPEARREPGTRWRPAVEAAALGLAIAEYGRDAVALIGPSAARLHDAYPRALGVAVVAVPKQRPEKATTAGKIRFVLRDVETLDLVRTTTELTQGWMTSVEETLLDLAGNWPRWPVSNAARLEMVRLLAARSSTELLNEIGRRSRRGAALARVQELTGEIDDQR